MKYLFAPFYRYKHWQGIKTYRFFLLAGVLWLLLPGYSSGLKAQKTPQMEDVINVEKDIKLSLLNIKRQFDAMRPVDRRINAEPQIYRPTLVNIDLPTITPLLTAVGTKPSLLPKLYKNQLRAGFGNYLTSYVEGHFASSRNEKFNYGAHLRHLSSLHGPVDKRNSGAGESGASLWGKKFTKAGTFSADVGYNLDALHFYGYVPGQEPIPRSEIRQYYHQAQARTAYQYGNLQTDWQLSASLSYHYLTDRFNLQEHNGIFDFSVQRKISEQGSLVADGQATIARLQTGITNQRDYFGFGMAYLHTIEDRFDVRAGAKLAYDTDLPIGEQNLFVYPDLSVNFQLVPKSVSVFATVTGGIEQITVKSLIDENPFLAQDLALSNINRLLDASLGTQISLGSYVGLLAKVGYERIRNLFFFQNNRLDLSRFELVYDTDDTRLFSASLQGSINFSDFSLIASSSYFNYNTETFSHAWHRPEWINQLTLNYRGINRLVLEAGFVHLAGVRAFHPQLERTLSMLNIFDANLKGEYTIKDRYSVFLQISNVASLQYQRYYRYPARGLTAVAGGSFSF